MDRQSLQLGDGGAATQEWLYPGAGGGSGGQPAPQDVDGTFLMDLLEEDAPGTEQQPHEDDVDQLSRVIQSLEAEIDGGRPPLASAPPTNGGGSSKMEHVSGHVDGGGLLDDMLSDLDSSSPSGPRVAEALPPFEDWAEVQPPAVGAGHDIGDWYLDDDDGGVLVGGYEFREQCYYGYSDSLAVDQVYSPLWE